MATFNISSARESLADVIELAQSEAVHLQHHGKDAAVVVSPDRFEWMMDALDEVEDEIAFDLAMKEEGKSIPWEQAKADLGWE